MDETGTAVAGVVGRLGRHASRPERLALLFFDGKVSNWFAMIDTRETVARILAQQGLELHDDDTVSRAC